MSIYDCQILLVDDEPELLKMLSEILASAGYANVLPAKNAAQADSLRSARRIDLALLDVMLPDMDGFSLFEKWRREGSETPVIFLSARDEDTAKLRGLGLGADDYITKPFLAEELILRVGAVLRRTAKLGREGREAQIGGALVKFDEGVAVKGGTEIRLTAKELELLAKLCDNRGRIVTTDALLSALWPDGSYGCENSLMVHVRRLREKIEDEPSSPAWIKTVRGLGYRLEKAREERR